ncbi:MAG: hypothetical protein FIB07_08785 [Candidatus Methanoperedens sp.]|nr:hypothetical protein [Candidatus Methanoperedens sp.]
MMRDYHDFDRMLDDMSNRLLILRKRGFKTFYDHPYETIILSFVISIVFKKFFNNLSIDNNLYYLILSSIFQGMFSILALAGLFIIFKTEQLSNDISKSYDIINHDASHLYNFKLRNLCGSIFTQKDFLAIRELLSNRDKKETEENLNKITDKIKNEIKIFEQEKGSEKYCLEIRQYKLVLDDYSKNITLIFKCESLKSDLIKFFKLPLFHGMLIIILAVYFLPLIDWKSNLSFHIPITIIIGTSVFHTIIVVLEILYLINMAMWGKIENS